MCRRQNLEIGFGFKSDTAVFTISFCFLSSPVLLLFLPHFFSCAWPLVGVILEGTVFEKTFRILKLDEWKNSWVVKEDFHGNFWVNVTFFLPFFSGLLLVGFERSLHPAQMSLAVKTDDVYGWQKGCRSARVVTNGSEVNRLSSLLFCVDMHLVLKIHQVQL